MLYRLFQWVGGIALHWFYRDVRVLHSDRIPRNGPLLIAMNHQNALVDAIVAQAVVPRDLRMTAKATLAQGIAGATLMRLAGVILLRRTTDETGSADPLRNRTSFESIIAELRAGGAVLIFPEGKSHNEPVIAPLKTGLARAALRAREAGVTGIQIIPIGVTFESKAEPNTVVVAQVAEVISVDDWPNDDHQKLTDAVAERLRLVSLTADINPKTEDPVSTTLYGRRWPVRAAAWWGRITHKVPITYARRLALRKSSDEGEPAMYTMTFGLALVLLSYVVGATAVALIFNGITALLFLASLVVGAYWAAYAEHRPES